MKYVVFLFDTMLLQRHFAVVTVAVGVVSVPEKLSKLPPVVNRVLWDSSFWGLMLQTSCPYVTFLVSKGI